jgi:F-type H+-transporting ATPase subunit b
MVEIDKIWFLVQLVNFLALVFLLNILLFKPLLKLFEERKDATEGALEEAKKLEAVKNESLEDFQKDLAAAREKAREIYNALREEGLAEQKRIVSEAQDEALREIEKARAEIRQEAEKARKKLGEDVRVFSDEIVRKLVEV